MTGAGARLKLPLSCRIDPAYSYVMSAQRPDPRPPALVSAVAGREPDPPAADLTRVVAVALTDDLDRPRRVLAARRTAPVQLAGQWEFPGGKVEPGESPTEAVHREIREELGISISLGDPIIGPDGAWWPLRPGWVMALWWAVADAEPQLMADHDELRWLAPDALDEVPWLVSNTAIVTTLAARLGRT